MPAAIICHGTDCRTLTGSALRTDIPAAAANFVLRSGLPKSYVKTAGSSNKRRHALLDRVDRPADVPRAEKA